MENITDAVKDFLRNKEIPFEQTKYEDVLKVDFPGENANFTGFIYIDEKQRVLKIQTLSPVVVPACKKTQVSCLLMKINQFLLTGSFQLTVDEDLVICNTGIILGNSDLQGEVMKNLLFANWWAIDKYFPIINAVIFGNILPETAVKLWFEELLDEDDQEQAAETFKPTNRFKDLFGKSLN